jgi:hypothetical protein
MPDEQAAAAVPDLGALKDFQTRFLFPFFYERHAAARAAVALEAMTARPSQDKVPLPLWERVTRLAGPDRGDGEFHLYTDELFDHVVQYLFGNPEAGGCCYLRANKALTDTWFKGMVAEKKRGEKTEPLAPLTDGASIEVFLSPQGVGVLSVTLVPKKKNLPPEEAADFNYHLAQFRRHDLGCLRRPNPKDNPAIWQRMSDADRAGTRDSPPDKAPLLQRLGVLGGWFDLNELVHVLLEPLKEQLGRHDVQDELMVYTVARFGPGADFAEEQVRDRLAPLLSGLAQVEEARHSGSRPGEVTTANLLLNRRHWAAAGLLGSAHLIADQPPEKGEDGQDKEVGFNAQKMNVIRDKYFIPFLVALLRRLGLNRAIEEASNRLQKGGEAEEEKLLESLRADQLKFALRGRFAQISCRQALHRYYQVAQKGLDVHDAWESASQALADLDAKRHAVTQQQIGRDTNESLRQAQETAKDMSTLVTGMNKSLATVAHVQVKVEEIEVAIISVYAAHLWHMFADGNEGLWKFFRNLPDPRYHHWFEDDYWFISLSVAFVAIITLCASGFYLLRSWKKWYPWVWAGAVFGLWLFVFALPWGWLLRDDMTWSYIVAVLLATAASAAFGALALKRRRKGAPAKAL